MAFAGLDVGTSGSKMLVYDLDGNVFLQLPENTTNLAETAAVNLTLKR